MRYTVVRAQRPRFGDEPHVSLAFHLDYRRIPLSQSPQMVGDRPNAAPHRRSSHSRTSGWEANHYPYGKVAICGYLFDRHEGDHLGNLAELRRLLAALDLDLEVVWLSGNTFEDLRKVRNASAIISLPYGRKAAATLAERLRIPLVETVLPFGFGPTERFLRDVATALQRQGKVEAVIEDETARCAPLLEWVIPFLFQNSRIGFIGDPNHLSGVADILDMMGSTLAFAMCTAGKASADPAEGVAEEKIGYEPTQRRLMELVPKQISEVGLDLLITTNTELKLGNVPVVEFGYPSYYTHFLTPRPFMGFSAVRLGSWSGWPTRSAIRSSSEPFYAIGVKNIGDDRSMMRGRKRVELYRPGWNESRDLCFASC